MNKFYYFTAAWCGPCRVFKPTVQTVAAKKLLKIQYVDVDSSNLPSEFNITSVPTMVVVDEKTNQEVKRRTGVMSESQLIEFLGV